MKQATWVSERYKITPPPAKKPEAEKPEAEKKETQEKQEVSHG
jgi:hypothetical protein